MQRWSASLGRRFFSSSRLGLDASPVGHVYSGAFPVISPKILPPGSTHCFMSNRQLPLPLPLPCAGFSRPSPLINVNFIFSEIEWNLVFGNHRSDQLLIITLLKLESVDASEGLCREVQRQIQGSSYPHYI